MFTFYRNDQSTTANRIIWIVYAFVMAIGVTRIVGDISHVERSYYTRSYYTWPSNEFWLLSLATMIVITIILGFAYNWGPIIPCMAAAAILTAIPGSELQALAIGFVIGLAWDLATYGLSKRTQVSDAA